jgi:hypothetical protein
MLLLRYGSENTGSGPASNKRVRHVPRWYAAELKLADPKYSNLEAQSLNFFYR